MPSPLSRRLGKLKSFVRTKDGMTGMTNEGSFRVRIFSESIIQITASETEVFDDFSYAVCASPIEVRFELKEGVQLVLSTSQWELTIERDPVSFVFRDDKGRILNEDDAGLGISWIGEQITCYKKLQEGERFIGLGEKTGNLDRKGSGYQNWNTDAYGYHSGTDPLYCSTPFYIGIHNGVQYGIFFDNSHKTFFNFGASNDRFASFSADAGQMNYYVICGETVAELIRQYTFLTGRTPLPPKWSIGYQQCRYSYYPDKEVLTTARNFREKQIPADVIVMDIHYMDQYKIFTWDTSRFSDPQALIGSLKEMGFEIVLMCDPGIKIEKGYHAYDDGLADDVFIKYPDGKYYSGQVWPGWCHFPDFSKPVTRSWWKKKIKDYSDLGVEGYWNDMNEPASWGFMLPENIEFDFDGHPTTARNGRNVYGLLMARSTYEATRSHLKGRRPFNLTRSGYSGVQRYAAIWTGDNVSYDEHMMLGVRLVNSLGLSGIAFAGYDMGGFVGDATPRLFARWISIGSLSPFFRGHTMINTRDSEPWSFGEQVEQISRNYIRLRYQLMPYLYSLFYEASQTGMPVQRSLAIELPHEPRVYQALFQHQYVFGPFILIAPVESTKDLVKVFLPPGEWYSIFDGKKYDGNQEVVADCPIHRLPVFMRGGSIIPAQEPVQSTKDKVDKLILHVYRGTASTQFDYYEDDGVTYGYESGDFAARKLEYHPSTNKIILSKQEGNFKSAFRTLQLVLHGFHSLQSVQVNDRKHELQHETHSFFLPLEKFDPINDPDSMGHAEVQVVSMPYASGRIEISL